MMRLPSARLTGRTAAWRATRSSYGDAFADVYDEWYAGISDAERQRRRRRRAGGGIGRRDGGRRGCSSSPSAPAGWRCRSPTAGVDVVGIDASAAMLDRLRARDPDGRGRRSSLGDMVDDLPTGRSTSCCIAYNSLFNLEDADRQAACFARRRRPPRAGRACSSSRRSCPRTRPATGTVVAVRSMTAAEVVLSISEHDPAAQRAAGHFVQFVDGERVRLRPWAIRYAAAGRARRDGGGRRARARVALGGLRASPVRRRQPPPRQRLRAERGAG